MTHEEAPEAEVPPRPTTPLPPPPPSSGARGSGIVWLDGNTRLAPDARITVPEGGVPLRFDDGPIVGTVTAATVDERGVTIRGQMLDGTGFEASPGGLPRPVPDLDPDDLDDLDDIAHPPDRWRSS